MDRTQYPPVYLKDILKTFWNGIRKNELLVIILTVSIVLVGIAEVIVPLFYKRFFDVLIASSDVKSSSPLIEIIIYILLLNIAIWFFYRVATFTDNRFLTSVSATLRQNAFDYLVNHSYSFFSNNFTGSLVQRVNRFARAFDRLADKMIWNVIPLFIKIIGVGAVIYVYKPALALIMLFWAVLFILFNYFVSVWKLKYDIRVSETDSKTSGALADTITNHNAVQLFTGTSDESARFKNITEDQAKAHLASLNLSAGVEAVQALLIFIIEFFVFYIAIRYWQEGLLSVGFFVLIQAYIIGLAHKLWDFSRVVRDLYESYADAKEMVEIMYLPHEIKTRPGALPLKVQSERIEFKNVSFSFQKTREVLHDFSFSIEPGEKVALVGPSGAGKSTIVKLLLRLHEPTSGKIEIDGQDTKSVTLQSLRENIALVPQDTVLFHRTLLENIRYGRKNASDDDIKLAASLSHSVEFIGELPNGFKTFVGERGIKLSGGERQRIAIARAILKNAPILVLDEATASLDSNSEMLIQDALDNLMKKKTVIVIAHRLSTIRKMDRIIVIEKGRIIESGRHTELLTKRDGLYKKLWLLQAGGFIQDQTRNERYSAKPQKDELENLNNTVVNDDDPGYEKTSGHSTEGI